MNSDNLQAIGVENFYTYPDRKERQLLTSCFNKIIFFGMIFAILKNSVIK